MKANKPEQAIARWLEKFNAALAGGSYDAAADLFADESYWRDLVAFTWNIKTIEGKDNIRAALAATMPAARPAQWRSTGEAATADGVTEGWLSFSTGAARGFGHLRLKDGKCWTLLTTLKELKGFEEKNGAHGTRETGIAHGAVSGRENWLEQRRREAVELGRTRQPYCVIIGGGQGGIALAARLRRLEVPTIVIEKNPRAGDSWRNRYRSLCLHDPVWYDHLPYLPFPDHWPVFSPKDKIGDWLESYAKIMELNYWSSTECLGAEFDDDAGQWAVQVKRDGETITLRPRQLVLATGMSGVPNMPEITGADRFRGVLCHSSQHVGGEEYRGQKCVVLGANNSAHDICADLWEHGADVTMVQRSSTHIARSDTLMELALGGLYSEEAVNNGITTDKADLIFA